ncbi:MAG: helix-hairpin-helix domain-containing protein [Candidatus Aminicenantes bacterium]|nr:helix-hairpin-helix domain-containing protein [Candidatus Aminicenantes bacterium]
MTSLKNGPPRAAVLRDLQRIPGVGPKIAHDLWRLGVGSIEDLKGADPEKLYDRLCDLQRAKVDRCALYVFRSAVYFASRKNPKPDLLKWWNWKDKY